VLPRQRNAPSPEAVQKEVPGVPIPVCVNRVDIATREHLDTAVKELQKIFEKEEIIEISSKTGANESFLLRRIQEKLGLLSDFHAR